MMQLQCHFQQLKATLRSTPLTICIIGQSTLVTKYKITELTKMNLYSNMKTSKAAFGSTGAVDRSEEQQGGTQNKDKGYDGQMATPCQQTKFDGRCDALKGHIFDCKGSGLVV